MTLLICDMGESILVNEIPRLRLRGTVTQPEALRDRADVCRPPADEGHETRPGLVCEFLLAPIEQTTAARHCAEAIISLGWHRRRISTIPSKSD
jgi:hypothetical protein